MTQLRRHSGKALEALSTDLDELWAVERGLQLRNMAGFRDVLVHGYLEVDVARVHRVLNAHLDDFATFARHVEAWLGD